MLAFLIPSANITTGYTWWRITGDKKPAPPEDTRIGKVTVWNTAYRQSTLNDHLLSDDLKLQQCWTKGLMTCAQSYGYCNTPTITWLQSMHFALMMVCQAPPIWWIVNHCHVESSMPASPESQLGKLAREGHKVLLPGWFLGNDWKRSVLKTFFSQPLKEWKTCLKEGLCPAWGRINWSGNFFVLKEAGWGIVLHTEWKKLLCWAS